MKSTLLVGVAGAEGYIPIPREGTRSVCHMLRVSEHQKCESTFRNHLLNELLIDKFYLRMYFTSVTCF